MAGGSKKNTSMSAMGRVYDALFAQTQDQSKKYGKGAKGDFVAEDFSDGIASGIIEVAANLAVNPKVADTFQSNIVKYWNEKLTGGFGLDLNDAGLLKELQISDKTKASWPTAARDEYGNTIGADTELKVVPEIKISNLNDFIVDPASIAEKAADSFFDSWKAAMNAKALAGIGNAVQRAANYAQLRSIGVDSSIAATVAHSIIADPFFNQDAGTGVMGTVGHAIINARQGADKSLSGLGNIRDSVVAESLAMYSGVTDEQARQELSQYIRGHIFNDTVANVRGETARVGGNYAFNTEDPTKPWSFTDLFATQRDTAAGLAGSKRNILHEYTQAELFAINPYGVANPTSGYGLVLKNSLQSAVQAALSDPTVAGNPRLRDSLMRMFSSLDDEASAKELFSALGDAGANGFRDMSKLVDIGVRRLGSEHARVGNFAEAARMNTAAATIGTIDGTMSWGDWVSYFSYRQKQNGILGTSSILMSAIVFGDGDALRAFVDGAGAINLFRPSKPVVGSSAAQINGTYFMDYLAERDGSIGLFKEFTGGQWVDRVTASGVKESEVFAKYLFGYTNADGKDFDKKRVMGWTQIGWTVPFTASSMQKGAYLAHVFHPYQFATGLINGKTPQHLIWIGSGYGKYLHDPSKWSNSARWAYRLASREGYKRFLEFSKKAEMIIGLPGRVLKDATQKVAQVVLKNVVVPIVAKIGGKLVARALLDVVTSGAAEIIFWAYTIINWLTFGLVDKLVKKKLKQDFTAIMVILQWLTVVVISIVVLVVSVIGFIFMLTGASAVSLFAPDPDYVPQLVDANGNPRPTPTVTVFVPPPGGGNCKEYTSGVAGSYTQEELESGNIGAGTCNSSLPDSEFSVPGIDKDKFIEVAESYAIWQTAAEVPPGSGLTPNLARECYNYVVCKAEQAGVNPAMALLMWMHESAASNYTFYGIGSRIEDMGIHCYTGETPDESCACGTTPSNNLKAQIELFSSLAHYDCGNGLIGWATQYGTGSCSGDYGTGYVAELQLEWSWFGDPSAFPTWVKDPATAQPGLNCDAAWVPRQ